MRIDTNSGSSLFSGNYCRAAVRSLAAGVASGAAAAASFDLHRTRRALRDFLRGRRGIGFAKSPARRANCRLHVRTGDVLLVGAARAASGLV